MDIVSPKSPLGIRLSSDVNKGATVFLSHVRRTFARHPVDYTGELVRLLDDIASFTRVVSSAVTEASTPAASHFGHSTHAPLEATAEGATEHLYRLLAHDGYCCIILSKGCSQPLTFDGDVANGNYVVCVSPLDGDPVVADSPVAGTMFSVYKRRSSASLPGRGIDLKQKLSDQVAAGYCSYSSATTLHYSMGHGTFSFVMHPVAQQYFLQPAMRTTIAENPAAVYCDRRILVENTPLGRATGKLLQKFCCNVFSTGCLVSDVHLLLRTGGVLIAQSVHLLCEAAPIAYIVEQAGGVATDEFGDRILEMAVTEDHDVCVTVVVGSRMDHANLDITGARGSNGSITNGVASNGNGVPALTAAVANM